MTSYRIEDFIAHRDRLERECKDVSTSISVMQNLLREKQGLLRSVEELIAREARPLLRRPRKSQISNLKS